MADNKSWILIVITSFTSLFVVASFFYLMSEEAHNELDSDNLSISFQYAYLI